MFNQHRKWHKPSLWSCWPSRACAIAAQLPGVAFGEGPKPKGMRATTFARLVNKYRAAERQTLAASMAWLEQVHGRLRVVQKCR